MKSRMDTTEIVVGLDIGTTKVSAVVGEVDADGITILGVGNVPCRGLRKGVVSNIEVVQAQEAVALASEQYITAQYGFNLAKAMLARSLGSAEDLARSVLGIGNKR